MGRAASLPAAAHHPIMGACGIRHREHGATSDILHRSETGHTRLCANVSHTSSLFLGIAWHMDPSRMPRAFCIGTADYHWSLEQTYHLTKPLSSSINLDTGLMELPLRPLRCAISVHGCRCLREPLIRTTLPVVSVALHYSTREWIYLHSLHRASNLPYRIALVLFFPAAIMGLNLGLSLKRDAIQPADSLNCDATHPIWYASPNDPCCYIDHH